LYGPLVPSNPDTKLRPDARSVVGENRTSISSDASLTNRRPQSSAASSR
jgi:hypothetical protein